MLRYWMVLVAALSLGACTVAQAEEAMCEAVSNDGQLRVACVKGEFGEYDLKVFEKKKGKWVERFSRSLPVSGSARLIEGVGRYHGRPKTTRFNDVARQATLTVTVQFVVRDQKYRYRFDDLGNGEQQRTWTTSDSRTGDNVVNPNAGAKL